MGRKTNPIGFRLGTQFFSGAKWFAEKNYTLFLHEDIKLRKYLTTKLQKAGLDKIEIERSLKKIKVNLMVSKPGMVIGRSGAGIEELRKGLERISNGKVQVSVVEVKLPDLSAELIAQDIAHQIERRLPAKRVALGAVEKIMTSGAKGAKVIIKGRLGGAEMARAEKVTQGSVPLTTLNAEVDFAQGIAMTKFGTIGVKVWINKGFRSVNKRVNARNAKQNAKNSAVKESGLSEEVAHATA